MVVTATAGGPVAGVIVQVSGAATGTASCSMGTTASTCYLPGVAGTYNLEVTASGFQTTQRTVTVEGTSPECGCPTVLTQHLDIVLTGNP
jgi:metal-sulfur cluster biosynthetic enzyme